MQGGSTRTANILVEPRGRRMPGACPAHARRRIRRVAGVVPLCHTTISRFAVPTLPNIRELRAPRSMPASRSEA